MSFQSNELPIITAYNYEAIDTNKSLFLSVLCGPMIGTAMVNGSDYEFCITHCSTGGNNDIYTKQDMIRYLQHLPFGSVKNILIRRDGVVHVSVWLRLPGIKNRFSDHYEPGNWFIVCGTLLSHGVELNVSSASF
jgi:hypothetical protein